jgi:hypothetical protein
LWRRPRPKLGCGAKERRIRIRIRIRSYISVHSNTSKLFSGGSFLGCDAVLASEYHAMKAYGGSGGIAPSFLLTSALDGGEWSATRPGRVVM